MTDRKSPANGKAAAAKPKRSKAVGSSGTHSAARSSANTEPATASDAAVATAKVAPADQPETVAAAPLFIVGLGASAGGLQAMEAFFRRVPTDSNMGFVVVSHLDPMHASRLADILQRFSDIPVVEAVDMTPVAANHAYVIPPNRELTILHGVLHLTPPEEPRGLRMPIDAFFRSLAEDQGEQAIGILLSGTGSDGTLGLRAILSGGGLTLVQDPATARYDGMLRSAIQSGYATHILAPEDLFAGMRKSSKRLARRLEKSPNTPREEGINRILMRLRSATGHDFSQYKKSTIGRRIERRMGQHNIDDPEFYARYLRQNPDEARTLFRELLINVTSFFRDPEAFIVLKQEILPQLFADKPDGYVFRVWVPGCATGEEAYSIAMLLREYMDEIETRPAHGQPEFHVKIYSTDLDDEAIDFARAGLYPVNISQDVAPERLRRFFVKEDNGYRIKKEIREMVVFAVQNVIKDPPFTRLDLLCCRNVMIYLEPELQDRLLPNFHYALKPGGVLFLSPSESIGNHGDLFVALNRKWKLYRTTPSVATGRVFFSQGLSWSADKPPHVDEDSVKKSNRTNFAEITQRALLQSYAPASVVTDLHGNILFVHGETGRYLRPAPGQASLNLVDMAREDLQMELRTALVNATSRETPTLNREVVLKQNGHPEHLRLSVRALPDPDAGLGLLLVSFEDVPTPPETTKKRRSKRTTPAELSRIGELEHELAHTRENLQATIEEQQASNEELKSTNEELQSTNEELQSTNEELETSKEELQSLNEELITVNAELQAKIEQLAGMQNDMKNLLDNIHIGTLFLDNDLHIRRFTREAGRIYRLVSTDVGRPLADIKSNLRDDLVAEARAVHETLRPCEQEVQGADGTWYLSRIQPYRTLDNVIDGVVLTFTDITSRVAAEAEVRNQRELAEAIVNTLHEPLLVLDKNGTILSASRAFYQHFKTRAGETLGHVLFELSNKQWDIPSLRQRLDSLGKSGQTFDDFRVEHVFPKIGLRTMLLNARSLASAPGDARLILLAMEDISKPDARPAQPPD